MPNGNAPATITGHLAANPPVELSQYQNGLTVTFPTGSGTASLGGTLTLSEVPGGSMPPVQLSFQEPVVMSFPGSSVATVDVTTESGGRRQIEVPDWGSGYLELPQGGSLIVTFPGGPIREGKVKVTTKGRVTTRLFSEGTII